MSIKTNCILMKKHLMIVAFLLQILFIIIYSKSEVQQFVYVNF